MADQMPEIIGPEPEPEQVGGPCARLRPRCLRVLWSAHSRGPKRPLRAMGEEGYWRAG